MYAHLSVAFFMNMYSQYTYTPNYKYPYILYIYIYAINWINRGWNVCVKCIKISCCSRRTRRRATDDHGRCSPLGWPAALSLQFLQAADLSRAVAGKGECAKAAKGPVISIRAMAISGSLCRGPENLYPMSGPRIHWPQSLQSDFAILAKFRRRNEGNRLVQKRGRKKTFP